MFARRRVVVLGALFAGAVAVGALAAQPMRAAPGDSAHTSEQVREGRFGDTVRTMWLLFDPRFTGDRAAVADRMAVRFGLSTGQLPLAGPSVVLSYQTAGRSWDYSALPVSVYYNPSFDSVQIDPATHQPESVSLNGPIDRAIATWNSLPDQWFRFRSAGTTATSVVGCDASDGINSIRFSSQLEPGVLARTCTAGAFTEEGLRVMEFDIEVTTGVYWTTALPTPSFAFDLDSAVVHELGHALGLPHSDDPAEVMGPEIDRGQTRRTPTAGDMAAVREIYGGPAIPPFAGTVTPNGFYVPGPNAVAVEGRGPIASVAAKVAEQAGRPLLTLWVLTDKGWVFFVPAAPAVYGGLDGFAGPVATVIAVLG